MEDIALYADREATWVKHEILKQYLQKLAYKLGWFHPVVNYVDGFAGPWQHKSEALTDTSPYIAIQELRAAREGLADHGRTPRSFRCCFIEKDKRAYQTLTSTFLQTVTDMEIKSLNGEFEQHIADVLQFAKGHFTFFFIDPTGWTGFGMNAISPILKYVPGEVLINFMTKDIKRFVDDPNSVALSAYNDLFGTTDYRMHWQGLAGQDREDAIVETYCQRVKTVGQFTRVVSTMVLHPRKARTHFHLVYATRSRHGLRAFRDVEANVMKKQVAVRAAAQHAHRTARTSQLPLFGADEPGDERHFAQLRGRYLARSQAAVRTTLEARERISYDELEEVALTMPLTWQSDLKAWLKDWKNQGLLRIEGLAPRASVPQRDRHHFIVWLAMQPHGTL